MQQAQLNIDCFFTVQQNLLVVHSK